MSAASCRPIWFCLLLFCLGRALQLPAYASDNFSIQGTVRDSQGAVIRGARVELVRNENPIASTHTDKEGNYRLQAPAGRYEIHVSAASFQASSEILNLSAATAARADFVLQPSGLNEQITVTATGLPTPEAQLGYSVDVLKAAQYPQALAIDEPLRQVPGVQATQSGRLGQTTSVFIRGGASDAAKVLVDGLPATLIGGFVEFSTLAATGVEQIETLRGPNSALYGSDALAGLISLTSDRGGTPLPLFTYAADGGNFGTYHQEGTLGGAFKKFDYFSDFSVINTQNGQSSDSFHGATYAGNFGWSPLAGTSLRVTVRHVANNVAEPNAIELYEIPDDSGRRDEDTYIGATFENQTTSRWHNLVRYGAVRLHEPFTDYAPTGIPYDAFGTGSPSWYIGAPVTLQGANGYAVSGQGIFQYPGAYPDVSINTTNRDFIYAQSDYRASSHLIGLFGFKYEDEHGESTSTGSSPYAVRRGNYTYTMQISGDFLGRLYYNLGSGVENNALFGVKATPRGSLAYYLFRPGASRLLSGTKLRASFGNGIKEPSLFQQESSLYTLLAGLGNGGQLIAQYGVTPVGAERSRSYDGGLDQELAGGRARASFTYFHNEFTHGVEYVPQTGLVALGVPVPVAQAALFGAYVNSLSVRSLGGETELEYRLTSNLFLRSGYTYLDAVVQHSFSSDALAPSFNPSFPQIPIGVFSPLVGARPFRAAPHSGYFALSYSSRRRWAASLTGTLVGRRDDSDFLYDKNGGNTMLLPNRNLDAAYQRLDLSGSFRLNRFVQFYSAIENLASQHYSEAFGYPSLPFTFRSGIKFSLGGEGFETKP